jgi:hypothetical protein
MAILRTFQKNKIQSRPYTRSSCCEAFTKGKKIKIKIIYSQPPRERGPSSGYVCPMPWAITYHPTFSNPCPSTTSGASVMKIIDEKFSPFFGRASDDGAVLWDHHS